MQISRQHLAFGPAFDFLAVVFALLILPCSVAESAHLKVEKRKLAKLNFSLFSVQNNDLIELKKLPAKVTLVNFWRADCPPCVKELPLLIKVSEKLNIRLITIAIQSYSETKKFWPQVPGNPKQHIALLGPNNPNGILRRFGNKTGAIPHSVLLNQLNQACSIKTGEITESWIKKRLALCKASVVDQ